MGLAGIRADASKHISQWQPASPRRDRRGAFAVAWSVVSCEEVMAREKPRMCPRSVSSGILGGCLVKSRFVRLLLLGLLLAGVVGGSTYAYLNDSATNADNVFRLGTVDVSLEPSSALFNVAALAPGGETTATLAVNNRGTLPYLFTMKARKTAGYTAVFEALTCAVTTVSDDTVIYAGPLSALSSAPRLVAPGATQELCVAVGLPSTAGNELAGDYCKVSFDVAAEQMH